MSHIKENFLKFKEKKFPQRIYNANPSLVLLDADIAGLINSHLTKKLDNKQLELLKKMLFELREELDTLPEDNKEYFFNLIDIGHSVIKQYSLITTMSPKEQLIFLLQEFHKGNYQIKDFCSNFERIFNFELSEEAVDQKEYMVFKSVFEVVIYYNESQEERDNWPGFKDEEDVINTVQSARVSLRLD